ncbi:hypothetical protein GCM10009548_50860 [Streptomyces malaysiensis subsp. malaysiensis]
MIRIGREALRGLLARRGVTFQRTKTWKESTDPDPDPGPGREANGPQSTERKERARIRSEKGIRWGGRPSTPQPDQPRTYTAAAHHRSARGQARTTEAL